MNETRIQPITYEMVCNAWLEVKGKGKSAGVDGVSLKAFEDNLSGNLYKIWNRMASGSYFPPAVREAEIPKEGGGTRTLGIPTVGDRVAQTVVKMHLEPSIDPQFHDSSFGYRPGRSQHGALDRVLGNCRKMDWLIDLDIKAFFDEIDHAMLMLALERHTTEKWVLMYVRRWLCAPMEKLDGTLVDRKMGTPQGGVISPLLANLFLHYAFDMWMQKFHPELPFVRYADDIVVSCRTEAEARLALDEIGSRLAQCKLRLHPDKTKIVHCKRRNSRDPHPHVSFDFLGFTFKSGKQRRRDNGQVFLGFNPVVSRKSAKRMVADLKNERILTRSDKTLEEIAQALNPMLRGWINYYGWAGPQALRRVFFNLDQRLMQWALRRYKRLQHSARKAHEWVLFEARTKPRLFAHWATK